MTNLVQLSAVRENAPKNVNGYLQVYFNRLSQESENTVLTYKKAVEDFFLTTRNKKLVELTESDLNYTMSEVESYQTELRKKYKASTVNTKMSAIKKTMDKLEGYGLSVNSKAFDVERYTEHDSLSYDAMTTDEVLKAIQLVKTTRKGMEKALFLKVAFATAFRKESIQNLKWSDIQYEKDYWTIKTLGKGNKWDKKKISNTLYSDLMKFKQTVDYGEKIFKLSRNTIDGMMKLIKENIDFGDRYIVFHSIKKSSIEEVGLLTNYNLKAMQAQGNHSNVTTTLNSYLSAKKIDEMVAVDPTEKIDLSKFEELTKEQLIDLIKKSDRIMQIKLLQMMED